MTHVVTHLGSRTRPGKKTGSGCLPSFRRPKSSSLLGVNAEEGLLTRDQSAPDSAQIIANQTSLSIFRAESDTSSQHLQGA